MTFEGRPNPEHAPTYAKYYFDRTIGDTHLLEALKKNKQITADFIRSLPPDKADFQYAEGKWTTKSVIAHINDTERIFQYRALRFSRKDETALPGFEEDFYASNANTDGRNYEDLAAEFEAIREASLQLFTHMTEPMLDFVGACNHSVLSARSAGWIMIGHAVHHCGIIKERYLVEVEE